LLAGTLNGAANGPSTIDFNKDDRTPTNTGQAIVAISIEAFCDVEPFKRNVDALIRSLRSSRRLPGVERIWLPGEQSHAKRIAYERDGIPLAPELVRHLNGLAADLGVAGLG